MIQTFLISCAGQSGQPHIVAQRDKHRRNLADTGAVDREKNGTIDTRHKLRKLALQTALERSVTKSGNDGAATDEADLLDDKELSHRTVSADGIVVLHPLDLDPVLTDGVSSRRISAFPAYWRLGSIRSPLAHARVLAIEPSPGAGATNVARAHRQCCSQAFPPHHVPFKAQALSLKAGLVHLTLRSDLDPMARRPQPVDL